MVAKERKRGMRFYSEMILVTVLSLLAASLWIEYTKGMLNRYFRDDLTAILASAIIISLAAVCFLHVLFSDLPDTEEGYEPERIA